MILLYEKRSEVNYKLTPETETNWTWVTDMRFGAYFDIKRYNWEEDKILSPLLN